MNLMAMWYFTDKDYRLMEKRLRKYDGKVRLIKNKRHSMCEMLMIPKWQVDRNDETLKSFEEIVRKNLCYLVYMDEDMMSFICHHGPCEQTGWALGLWERKHFDEVIRISIKELLAKKG